MYHKSLIYITDQNHLINMIIQTKHFQMWSVMQGILGISIYSFWLNYTLIFSFLLLKTTTSISL